MINKYVAIGLGALIALAPVAAVAQEQMAQAAPATTPDTSMAAPIDGTYRVASRPRPAQGQHGRTPGAGFGSPYAQDADGPRRSG
jgi:hypothetical protein